MFISFEGIDGCGKSTQVSILEQQLRSAGKEVLVLREPGATPLSEAIRGVLLNAAFHIEATAELLLFCASRRQLVETVIRPALEQGRVVICDRYADSSVAYQGYGRGIPLEQVRAANSLATGGLMPDLSFFLDISVAESLERAGKRSETALDRMERSGHDFFERVREGYSIIASEEPSRFIRIEGNQSIEVIASRIAESINKYDTVGEV